MTRREELLQAPMFTGKENLNECCELWIIPTRKLHDSGYRCMIFVIGYYDKGEYKRVRCEGYIDHLLGLDLGPFGSAISFSIDCDCGLVRLHSYGKTFRTDWCGTSTFEINPNHGNYNPDSK